MILKLFVSGLVVFGAFFAGQKVATPQDADPKKPSPEEMAKMMEVYGGTSIGEIVMSARSLSRFVLVLLVFGAMVLSSCNTMSGMGRDISSAGNSMENTAERSR
jgi:predicted small secreted protein